MEQYNQLTPQEHELLSMLAEECAEVIQVVGKILRHGYESYHPHNPSNTNRHLLNKELMDVYTIANRMSELSHVNLATSNQLTANWFLKNTYTHHQ